MDRQPANKIVFLCHKLEHMHAILTLEESADKAIEEFELIFTQTREMLN